MVIHAVVSTISRRNPDQSQDSSALMLVGQNRVTVCLGSTCWEEEEEENERVII